MSKGYRFFICWCVCAVLLIPASIFSQSFWDDTEAVCDPSSELVRSTVLPPFESKDTAEYDGLVLQSYKDEIDPIFDPLISFCGGTSFNIQNPVFYKLTATASIGLIVMDVLSCEGEGTFTGLQITLIGGDRDDIQVLHCDSDPIRQRDYRIQVTSLVPGEEYYLILDGYASATCKYRFRDLRGFGTYDFKDIEGVMINGVDINGDNSDFCKSANLDITVMSENEGFRQAEWQIESASTGELILDTISYSNQFLYTLNTEGDYLLKVDLVNECSRAPAAYQASFTIQSSEDEVLEPFEFCLEDFPNIFHPDPRFTEPIIDLNASQLVLEVSTGDCASRIIAPLAPIAPAVPTIIEKAFCGPGPHTFEGITFTETYTGQARIEGGASTGCDSLVIYELTVTDASGSLEATPCGTIEYVGSISKNADSSVAYQWTDASGNIVTDVDGDDKILTIETSGEYSLTVLVTEDDDICSFEISTVQGTSTDYSIALNCMSNGTSEVELSWTAVDHALNYTLMADGELVDVLSSAITSFIYPDISPGQEVQFELIAALPGGCVVTGASACGTVSCAELNDIRVSIVEASRTICLKPTTANITFSTVISGTVTDPVISWVSTGIISSKGVFDPTASGAGSFSIQAILKDGSCEYMSEEVIISVTPFDADVSFSIAERVCDNMPITLIYEGPIADPEDYTITVEGNPDIKGQLPGDLEISWLSEGEYQLNIILDNGECRSESEIKTVTVDKTELVESVRANANSASVTFSWSEVSCANTYALYADGRYLESTASSSYVYVFKEGENAIEFSVAIDDGSCSCTDISPMTIGSRQLCPIIRISIDPVGPLCLNENANLSPIQIMANIQGIERGGESFWSGTGVNESGLFFPNLAGIGSHTIQLEYIEAGCPFTEEITINITDNLEVDFSIIDTECATQLPTLEVSDIDKYMIFVGDDQVTESGYVLPSGSYSIEFADENGCMTQTEVSIDPAISLELQIMGETELKEGFKVEYILDNGPDEVEFSDVVWSFNGNLICDSDCDESVSFTSSISGELCADVTIAVDGCQYQHCLDITVLQDLKVYIPNSFMVNALPPNDRFKVNLNDPNATISNIVIFDRLGNEVYTEGNISTVSEYIGWDGTNQDNDKLLSGVYVFVLKIIDEEGKEFVHSGDITLLR